MSITNQTEAQPAPAADGALARELRDESHELLARYTANLMVQRDELLAVLRDVAALLPMAGRLHPDDLYALQTRVCAAIGRTGAA